jgi:hypothetical protein
VLGAPPPAERAYRIVVTPLPSLRSASAASGGLSAALELQARFTFPVFVEPGLAQTRGTFTQLRVAHGVLAIRIQNDGNVHLGGEPLTIVARGADGRTIASQEARGWSVLRGPNDDGFGQGQSLRGRSFAYCKRTGVDECAGENG